MKLPWLDVIDRVGDATGKAKEAIADAFQAALSGRMT